MEQKPYAASQVSASPDPHTNTNDTIAITPNALSAIIGTQFWVKLIGIVMFITVALQVLVLVFGLGQVPRDTMSGPASGAMFVIIIPVIFMVIYCILATRLLQYGKAISALAKSQNPIDFERAMEVQTKFWRLLGIITIIMIVIMIFAFISVA